MSDSNWRPRDYKSRALANWANSAYILSVFSRTLLADSAAAKERILSKTAKLFFSFFQAFFQNVFSFEKVGKRPVSHRYNRLPLLPSDPGGIQQELVAQDLPGAKVENFQFPPNKNPLRRNASLLLSTYPTENLQLKWCTFFKKKNQQTAEKPDHTKNNAKAPTAAKTKIKPANSADH